jgi:hypothetical protein
MTLLWCCSVQACDSFQHKLSPLTRWLTVHPSTGMSCQYSSSPLHVSACCDLRGCRDRPGRPGTGCSWPMLTDTKSAKLDRGRPVHVCRQQRQQGRVSSVANIYPFVRRARLCMCDIVGPCDTLTSSIRCR